MKIKKLAAQISRTKQMYLLTDAGDKQWAGTSSAIYLLPGNLPLLDTELLPLKTTNGVMYFIPVKYLAPIEDAENPILCVRHSGTSPVIAAKDGLFLTALFRPQEHKPSFVPWLAELYTGTKAAADVAEVKKFMEAGE